MAQISLDGAMSLSGTPFQDLNELEVGSVESNPSGASQILPQALVHLNQSLSQCALTCCRRRRSSSSGRGWLWKEQEVK